MRNAMILGAIGLSFFLAGCKAMTGASAGLYDKAGIASKDRLVEMGTTLRAEYKEADNVLREEAAERDATFRDEVDERLEAGMPAGEAVSAAAGSRAEMSEAQAVEGVKRAEDESEGPYTPGPIEGAAVGAFLLYAGKKLLDLVLAKVRGEQSIPGLGTEPAEPVS